MSRREQGPGLEQSDTDVRTGGGDHMEQSDGGRIRAGGKGSEAATGGVRSDTRVEEERQEVGGLKSEAGAGQVRSEAVSGGVRSESQWSCLPHPSYLSSLSSHYLETFFHWYGGLLARRPLPCIGVCLLIPALASLGLLNYRTEHNPYKLWIPQDSDYVRNHEWLWEKFPPDTRFHSIIVTAENVLVPEVMQKLLALHQTVSSTISSEGRGWKESCYRVPYIDMEAIADLLGDLDYDYDYDEDDEDEGVEDSADVEADKGVSTDRRRRRREAGELGFDPSIDLYPGIYCDVVQSLIEQKCLEKSLLELWAVDDYGEETGKAIASLTQQEILDAVNTQEQSLVYGRHQDFTKYLGSVKRNSSGHIVAAGATFLRFFGQVNVTAADGLSNVGSPVDQATLDWELAIIQRLLEEEKKQEEGTSLFIHVARSFADLSDEAISGDAFTFGAGSAIMFIYVQLMLGRFNFVEQRPGLSCVGILCAALGILTSYGLCSGLGLVFSPMHAIIPFLMLGIGIDDMFVIVQCYNNLLREKKGRQLSREKLLSLTMQHAGVAITVTSLTNVTVFAIGATTVLPALRSFCLYCAVGIAAVYIFQATIFTAAFGLDQRRMEGRRNGLLPCIVHRDWQPNSLSQRQLAQEVFQGAARLLLSPVGKALALLLTASILGVAGWGVSQLRQEFNPVWFIPQDSYLAGWFRTNSLHFPKEGERVRINIAGIDYSTELTKIESLVDRLNGETDILSEVDSWYTAFKTYTEENDLVDGGHWFDVFKENQLKFYQILTQFLFSQAGAKYQRSFNFMGDLVCGEAASEILLSSIDLTHKLFSEPSQWIPAMNRVKQLVSEANFSSRAFPVGTEYASWETDEIISVETYRNVCLSLVCVFVTTLLLIPSLVACLLVLASVLLTLVSVGGFMHFWGLTIDVISCVNLVIAVGLCVDYSAHITHCFMQNTGSRDERASATLRDMGPAVLNGGFSTFLAFVLTAASSSHVFSSFFKIFFLVVLFGLFHALVFLPVILSLLGPSKTHQDGEGTDKVTEGDQAQQAEGGCENIAFQANK